MWHIPFLWPNAVWWGGYIFTAKKLVELLLIKSENHKRPRTPKKSIKVSKGTPRGPRWQTSPPRGVKIAQLGSFLPPWLMTLSLLCNLGQGLEMLGNRRRGNPAFTVMTYNRGKLRLWVPSFCQLLLCTLLKANTTWVDSRTTDHGICKYNHPLLQHIYSMAGKLSESTHWERLGQLLIIFEHLYAS